VIEIEALMGMGSSIGRLLSRRAWSGVELDRLRLLATGSRCRAYLLAAAGDPTGALASLEAALRHHARFAVPLELGRTLFANGQVLRRLKEKRTAREAFEEATRLFDSLPAPLWAVRAGAETERIGGRVPTPAGLTPTERVIAEQVAQGLVEQGGSGSGVRERPHRGGQPVKNLRQARSSFPGPGWSVCSGASTPGSQPRGDGSNAGFSRIPPAPCGRTVRLTVGEPRREQDMPRYMVERHLPGITQDQLVAAAGRAKQTAARMTEEGTPVRYLRSTFVPADEKCYCLFEGGSMEAVEAAQARAGIPFECVEEAAFVTAEDLV
jgi:hypothetical protein